MFIISSMSWISPQNQWYLSIIVNILQVYLTSTSEEVLIVFWQLPEKWIDASFYEKNTLSTITKIPHSSQTLSYPCFTDFFCASKFYISEMSSPQATHCLRILGCNKAVLIPSQKRVRKKEKSGKKKKKKGYVSCHSQFYFYSNCRLLWIIY